MNTIMRTMLEITIYSSVMVAAILTMKAIWRGKIASKIIKFLWMLALVRMLLPVTFDSPFHLGALFPEKPAEKTVAAAELPAEEAPYTPVGDAQPPAHYQPDTDIIHADGHTSPQAETASPSLFRQAISYLNGISVWAYAFAAWAMGAAVFLLKTLNEYMGFKRRVMSGKNTENKLLYALLAECKASLKFKKDISVVLCRYLSTPVTFGLKKPIILLPVSFAGQIGREKLKMIIMHELCHIKNRDILRNMLWLVAKAVHWFNPLVRVAYRYYLEDVELACDETVISLVGEKDRFTYSQSLIDVVKLSRQKAKVPAALAFCRDKTKIRKRVENMIEPKKKLKSAGFISLIMAAVLIIGCFTTACQPKPDETTGYPAAQNNEEQASAESPEKQAAETPENHGENVTPAYEAIEHTEKAIVSDDGTLSVTIDADVLIPETDSFPVLEIEAEKITQEKVDAFLNEFFPQRQAIATSEIAQLPTKDNYLKLIEEREEWIKTKEDNPNEQGPSSHELWQGEIDFYRAQLDDAPDINPEIPEYDITKFSSIPLIEVFWDAELTAKELEQQLEDSTKRAEANNTQLIEYDIQTEDAKTYGIYALRSDRPKVNTFWFRDESKYYVEYGKENYGNIAGLDTTFGEAAATAEKAAHILGLDYMDMDYASADAYRIQGKKAANGHSYHFVFTRAVEGANVTYTQNIVNNPEVDYDSWNYNYFEIWIDDDGISRITWHSCSSTVKEVVSDDKALLSFDEIMDKAAQSFKSKEFAHSRNTYGAEQVAEEGRAEIRENKIIIDKITLGYMMTTDGDSTGEHMLVPVWDFIGRESISAEATNKKNGEKYEIETEMPEYTDCHSFLTINAIDGSIIDRRKGY